MKKYFIYSYTTHKGFSIYKLCFWIVFPNNGHWNIIQWEIQIFFFWNEFAFLHIYTLLKEIYE